MSAPLPERRPYRLCPPGLWLAVRRLGRRRLILLGYAFWGIAPLVVAAIVSGDPRTDIWNELWWLVPVFTVGVGGIQHWYTDRDWRYYEEGNARELLARL